MKPIRILHAITSLAGGAGFYAYQLASRLDRSRFDVTLAFGPGYPLDKVVLRERLPHRQLAWTRGLNPAAVLRGARQLDLLVRQGGFDIIHLQCSLAAAVGRVLARRHDVSSVFTVQALASRDFQPALARLAYGSVERAMDRWTDRYIFTTRRFADEVIARGIASPDKVSVIPQAIPIVPRPDASRRAAARARLGLSEGEVGILAAGRFEPQKGFSTLIEAFATVARVRPDARLLLCGDGPLRSELEDAARRRGVTGIRFLGWQEDAVALYAGADIFCLSSWWESFGYVNLEAMAAGLPLVVTAVQGVPEVVGHGACAEIVPPADAPALAEALLRLVGDPLRRARLGEAGRARLEAEYDERDMLDRMGALYETIAGRSPSKAARSHGRTVACA